MAREESGRRLERITRVPVANRDMLDRSLTRGRRRQLSGGAIAAGPRIFQGGAGPSVGDRFCPALGADRGLR